ncbi:SDR family oxidoreductase [Rathayibacter sp. CAU 1779]
MFATASVKTSSIARPDAVAGMTAVVTGASDGIGFALARLLALRGADLVLPVRDRNKGVVAADRIRDAVPRSRITLVDLDLASLDSVGRCADRLLTAATAHRIDILVCNAGIMLLRDPTRHTSVDGYELHFATNHLGHFALTAALLPALSRGAGVVVMQSSLAAAGYGIRWNDVQFERGYRPMRAYGASKRAVSLFCFELQRRSAAAGWGLTCNLAHPGTAQTNIVPRSEHAVSVQMRIGGWLTDHELLAQSAEAAARPAELAIDAALADRESSTRQRESRFFGPSGPLQVRGRAREHRPFRPVRSRSDAVRAWELSTLLSGATFPRVGVDISDRV